MGIQKFAAVKSLAFDYYGTIADKQGLGKLIDIEFPGHGEAMAKLWFATCQRYCFQNGMMDRYLPWDELTKAAFKFAAADMGIQPSDSFRDELIAADVSVPAYPETYDALQRLSEQYSLYVLSMGSPWMIKKSQQNAGIAGLFTAIITTQSDQVYKPGKAAYEIGVREIGGTKDSIGFVSGNSFDVIGSKQYGYPTAWIRRYDQPLDELGIAPDIIVSDLQELATTLCQ